MSSIIENSARLRKFKNLTNNGSKAQQKPVVKEEDELSRLQLQLNNRGQRNKITHETNNNKNNNNNNNSREHRVRDEQTGKFLSSDRNSNIKFSSSLSNKHSPPFFQSESVDTHEDSSRIDDETNIRNKEYDSETYQHTFTSVTSIRSIYRKRKSDLENASFRNLFGHQPNQSGNSHYDEIDPYSLTEEDTKPINTGSSFSILENSNPLAEVFRDLSYEQWCNDLSYRLSISNKVQDCLKNGQKCVLQSPLCIGERADNNDRIEALRLSKLMLQSLFTDVLMNTNAVALPNIIFWGPTPNIRIAEVMAEPHKKYLL